jgi:hypothetical protein
MRPIALAFALWLPAAALAEDSVAMTDGSAGPAQGFMFSTSISLNLPLTAPDNAARAQEEEQHRRDLYQRAVGECALLLDTVAKACEITSINVSTQINSNPGQPDYLYASANITMQVELK